MTSKHFTVGTYVSSYRIKNCLIIARDTDAGGTYLITKHSSAEYGITVKKTYPFALNRRQS